MSSETGRRVVNLGPLLDLFEAQEGEVEHIIGKTGEGKTYEATRRALNFLYSGYTVYTTWRLNLPNYYDEREHLWPVLRNLFLFRKHFFRFDLKKNWQHVDLTTFEDAEGIIETEKLARFLATRTDCIFMLDEGQDVFDSHKRAGAIARQAITRSRHMHKTLIIISQRAQAVDVNARGNVSYFYRCEKTQFPFLPAYFRVRRTDEIDEGSNYPIWVRHDSTGKAVWKAPIWHSAFARKRLYDAYDSWYMRQNQIRSQDINIDAFELSLGEKLKLLFMRKIEIRLSKAPIKVIPPLSTVIERPLNKPDFSGIIESHGRQLGTPSPLQIRKTTPFGKEKIQARSFWRDFFFLS